MKYAIDPEYPSNAAYAYKQEEATGQKSLRELDAENKKRIDMYRQCVENMDKLITVCTNIELIKRQGKLEAEPISTEVQVVKIGDFVLVTFPGEIFAEVGLRIKKQSPFPNTFIASCTNGSIGYAPATADYGKEPAYEDALTRLAPQWQEVYEKKVLEMLGRLKQSP